jgi:hypothetical protein
MKKNQLIHLAWTALLGSLLAVSCQTALETDTLEKHVSYDCTLEVNLDGTRTANTGSGTVWVADDALAVMHTDNGSTFYTSRFYYSGDQNAFKGRVNDVGDVNDWYMFYPYSESITNPKSVQITVPGIQTQTGNNSTAHLAGPEFPLFGKQLQQPKSQNMSVTMANVLGVIRYRVYNNTEEPIVVKRITLAAPVQVSGTFTADLTASTVQWTANGTTTANLTLAVEDGESIPAGQEGLYYVGSIPCTFAAGTQAKIKITAVHPSNPNQEIDYYEVTDPFVRDNVIAANTQKPFPVFNFDETHQNDPGSDTPTIKIDQNLTFTNAEIVWTLGDVYALNGQYDMPQQVAGAQTTVTYESSNDNVATISNGKILIKGIGTTTITARAAESDQYNPAEAAYTLRIAEAAVVPSSRTYTYVAPNNLATNETYLIAGSETNELSVALFPNVGVKSWSSQTTGSVNNGEYIPHKVVGTSNSASSITTEDADVIAGEVVMVKNTSDNTWKIQVKSTGLYLATPAEEYKISFVGESSAANFSISSGTNGATVSVRSGSDTYYFYHSGSAGGFTLRKSSTSNLRFYQREASSKLSQTISFANPTVTWTLGDTYKLNGTYSLPQVSGAATTVTYTSSNTNVATVSGTTVTILSAGSTTITATAAETNTYEGATATMTLVIQNGSVNPPTPTESAYVKVTEELPNWAGTYLFVDEDNSKAFAAFSANASSYAVNVTISNNQIAATSDIAKYALTVTDAGVQHANVSGQEAYDVRNSDGKYIYYSSSALQIADTNTKASSGSGWGGSSSSTAYYHAFKYFNASNGTPAGVQVVSSGHSSGYNKYYLGYASNAFSYSNSSADGRRVQLYKLTQGTTPTPDPGKQDQVLSFAEPTVTRTMETAGGTLAVQNVQGAQTSVTYTSSNTNVATVSGTTITIVGFGSTQIIATAASTSTYNSASAYYTLNIQQSSSQTGSVYQKASQLTVGGTYLIVDVADQRLMKGDTDGSFVNISPSNGVINDTNNSYAGYEFTVTQSGSKYCIKKGNQYLLCDYSTNQGNSSTGLVYVNDEPASNYLYSLTVNNGAFEFMTAQRNSTSTSEVLYYKTSSNVFKIGGSGVNVGVHLYLKTSGSSTPSKQDQNPYFASSVVTQTMATASGTMQVQSVQGAQGTVTYSSSNTSVATVSGTTITIKGFGSTVITASAAGNDSYNPGSASYTLTIAQSGSSTGNAYVKVSALTVGGTYLITDVADQRLFKGNADGSYVTVSPSGGVITDNDGSLSGYEFTVTQSGSKYCLMFNNTYLICDYTGSNSNSTTGLVFESTKPTEDYLYSVSVNSNGAFEFMTAQRNSTSTQEVLYYKTSSMSGSGQDKFKIGGSGKGVGVHLYLKDGGSGKQPQTLSFAQSTVTLTLEQASGTTPLQTVTGNKTTPVTYKSTNTSVADINGSTIYIYGFGSTTIEATAPANDAYFAGSASYTLTVRRATQEGEYNLENDAIYKYLNDAEENYTVNNRSSYSVARTYASGVSASNRYDWPKPVDLAWTNSASSPQVAIYNDAAHTSQEISAYISSTTNNSAVVYNLIPSRTYYYVVRSGNSTVASGEFTTEGRRRMMNIYNSSYGQNYANNCRDFGGQVTTSGKTIKYGRIFRGSNMDSTTDNQRTYLKNNLGIGLDVDLRGGDRKNVLFDDQNDIPAYEGNNQTAANLARYQGHTNESYSGTNDLNSTTKMKATLTRVMNAVTNGVNVYIHCMVGADRTGYTCMMLEAILGVPLERCDMDYEMTSFSCVGGRYRTGDNVGYYASGVSTVNGMSGNTYQEKAVKYANERLGIPMDLITAFQNAMLE